MLPFQTSLEVSGRNVKLGEILGHFKIEIFELIMHSKKTLVEIRRLTTTKDY